MSNQEFRNSNNRYINPIFRIIGATDEAIVRFEGTSGEVIQDSNITIDDTGNMTFAGSSILNVDEIQDVSGGGVQIERINNKAGVLLVGNENANSDATVEIISKRDALLWVEGDVDDNSSTQLSKILITQNQNNDGIQMQYDNDNQFVIRKNGNATPSDDMIIFVDATLTGGGTPSTVPTISGGIEALRIPPSGIIDFKQGIETDTIDESTVDTGVTIDGALLKDTTITVDDYFLSTPSTHYRKLVKSIAQSVPSGGTGAIIINYDTVEGSLGSFVNGTGIFTIDESGIYSCHAIMKFATNSTGTRQLTILSSSGIFGFRASIPVPARVSPNVTFVTTNFMWNFVPTDTLSINSFHLAGVALDVTLEVFIMKIFS